MQSLTGQYECTHRSVFGLDYFTARLDRLTLYANGRFALITQEKSRISHAAKTLASGRQTNMDAPETRREGSYSSQVNLLFLRFDDGDEEQAQIQEAGVTLGKDYFEKVSDTTFMPPPQRIKSSMEDIARGMKIAGTIGGTVLKAARSLQGTLQNSPDQDQARTSTSTQNAAPPAATQSSQQPAYTPPAAFTHAPPRDDTTLFCDQCGAPVRPGKRFCQRCGSRLP